MSLQIKRNHKLMCAVITASTLLGCSLTSTRKLKENTSYTVTGENLIRWNFDTLDGWKDGSQNMNGLVNYKTNNGVLNMNSRANTWDRPKIRTVDKTYNAGKYTWKVYIPKMGVGDMASIGAFIYNNDKHELDFEIGYGSTSVRKKLNASSNDVIAYMTSQALPFQSIPKKIKREQWYTLEIELIENNGKYEAIWYIDHIEMNRLNLKYGDQHPFSIFCSVENLKFIGDHIPSQDNYGLFDYVEFKAALNE